MNVIAQHHRISLLIGPVTLFSLVMLLVGCGQVEPKDLRSQTVTANTDQMFVGLAWPFDGAKGRLREGALLAQQHINAAGGIEGRELVLIEFNDRREVDQGMIFAQRVADDPTIAAVIAHLDTYIAVPTSSLYDSAGVLMITPGASGMPLTARGLNMVFRTFPNNQQQANALSDFAIQNGYNRIATYFVNNDYGQDLANFFERRGDLVGIQSVDRRSYESSGSDHRRIFIEWSHYQDFQPFDSIFLAGSLPESATIIQRIRESGLDVPIFGGAGLDANELLELGGQAVEGTVVISVFSQDITDDTVLRFVEAYLNTYGQVPDSAAAQGYDAVMLIAEAARRAGSVDPQQMAAELRGSHERWPEPWIGVTGGHRFTETGEIQDKPIVLNIVRDGEFRLLDRIQLTNR